MRKFYIVSATFFLIFGIIYNISFAKDMPKLYIEDTIKYENTENVTVNLYMKNADSALVTLGFDLKYDTSKLKYVNSKAGKDLNATMKLAEDFPEASKISVGILSLSGLKNDGLYYSFTFEVLDSKENIPLELYLKEAVNNSGEDVKIELQGGEIKISSNQTEAASPAQTARDQKISEFEKTNVNELEKLETIISQNGNVEILDEDIVSYEIEDLGILEILDDGTMIPNKEGTTKVRVKLNGEVIGNVLVEVKDGKVINISWTDDKTDFESTGSIQPLNKSYEKTNYSENINTIRENIPTLKFDSNIVSIVVALLIILLVLIIYIKNRKGK